MVAVALGPPWSWAKMAEEWEAQRREREGRTVCPTDLAQERMTAETTKRRKRAMPTPTTAATIGNSEGDERLDATQIAQCREMQLDELAALEAIYAESDEYVVADDADIDGLRERIEKWQVHDEGGVGDDLVSSIVQHPPTRFWLQLVVEDEANVMGTEQGVDLVATVLLQVSLPTPYPEASVPTMEVAYFCATDRNAQMSMDKALESLVHLEEDRLLQALVEQAQQIVQQRTAPTLGLVQRSRHPRTVRALEAWHRIPGPPPRQPRRYPTLRVCRGTSRAPRRRRGARPARPRRAPPRRVETSRFRFFRTRRAGAPRRARRMRRRRRRRAARPAARAGARRACPPFSPPRAHTA